MYNFLKNIFGIPSNDSGSRSEDPPKNDLKNNFRDPIWGSDDYEDDDEDFRSHHRGLGFPIDTADPVEIHRYFENMMDEMLKNFGMFGFNMRPGIEWNDGEDWNHEHRSILPFNSIEDAPKNKGSLRDAYLKPGYSRAHDVTKEDIDSDQKTDISAIKSLLRDEPSDENQNPVVQFSKPQIFSSQVYIRTIRRPDGTVETIKKVRDHTGKEETTVTKDVIEPNSPINPISPFSPSSPSFGDDEAGISIFKKFFPF